MEIPRNLIRYGGIGLLTAVLLATIVGGGWLLVRDTTPVDKALDEVRRVPLIGPLMAENRDIESRMRTAIEEEIRSPTQGGLSRPFSLVTDLRRQYLVPALRNADDASAIAAVAARAAFVKYMRIADLAGCRQFALGTFQRPDMLDTEGRRLFGEVLQTLEAAWRNGKAAAQPQRVFNRQELLEALRQAGFTKPDFERLSSFQTLSNEVSCDVEFKVDSAPPLLPADKRGPFSRALISN